MGNKERDGGRCDAGTTLSRILTIQPDREPTRRPLPQRKPLCCNPVSVVARRRRSSCVFMSTLSKSDIEILIHSLRVLVIDDNQHMRKIVRNLLTNVGVRAVH